MRQRDIEGKDVCEKERERERDLDIERTKAAYYQ